jgi:hypothetical protein
MKTLLSFFYNPSKITKELQKYSIYQKLLIIIFIFTLLITSEFFIYILPEINIEEYFEGYVIL